MGTDQESSTETFSEKYDMDRFLTPSIECGNNKGSLYIP